MRNTIFLLLMLASVVARADSAQPDYMLNVCKETDSAGDPMSAMRVVDPAYMLKNYLHSHDKTGKLDVDLASINVTLLESTTHGKIAAEIGNDSSPLVQRPSFTIFRYEPTQNYVGNDNAVFMAEFEGKRYKISVNLIVLEVVDESMSQCQDEPVLIKINKKS